METRTVKPPKALPNIFRKVMPRVVDAAKHSQGKKGPQRPLSISDHALLGDSFHKQLSEPILYERK